MNGHPRLESGLNTTVEHRGQAFHVQTQSSHRGGPVVESMVYRGGQVLVRMTASYDDVARRLGFNGDDARHLLELQHGDLIRKIRHGMLDDDDAAGGEPVRPAALAGSSVPEPWWRRIVICIRLPF